MSSNSKRKTLDIVGGTYCESCKEPEWEQIFGSGLRAALAVKEMDSCCSVILHTITESYVKKHMEMHYDGMIIKDCISAPKGATPIYFDYQNALTPPRVYYNHVVYPTISIKTENCIVFGMMENVAKVDAEYVVYDPQSPNRPIPFSETGSKAKHLCLVLNEQEAQKWTRKKTDEEVRNYMFDNEGCECLVIKKSASGAVVYENADSPGIVIPAYKTDHVWTIGSGDVFTAVFGYCWIIASLSPSECANYASLATACYSESKTLDNLANQIAKSKFEKHIPQDAGQVYLAGPFFTISERMFVNECRNALMSVGLSVFSPFHDVGLGGPDEVVPLDIEAIKKCKTIFAILNGMDPGTVFEVGFGVALGKKVVVFAEHETPTNLQMMLGTKCIVENDFITAVYKTSWITNE